VETAIETNLQDNLAQAGIAGRFGAHAPSHMNRPAHLSRLSARASAALSMNEWRMAMKKFWVLLLALSGLGAQATEAEAARVRFWGGLVITAQSGTCPNGNEVGSRYAVRFSTDTAMAPSTLSLLRSEHAYNYRVDGRFTATYKAAETVAIHDFGGDPGNAVRVRFTSQSPSTVSSTTNFINVTGQISGWDEGASCVVTFRMSLTKRPD
jgi:hypothetical protein